MAGAANQEIVPKINEYMDGLVKAGKFNGTLLIARDGKVLVSKGYGMSNFELDVPNTPLTKFRVGSISGSAGRYTLAGGVRNTIFPSG